MRILLVYPPIYRSANVYSATLPLGLLQVAGYLRSIGNHVQVLNLDLGGNIQTTSINAIRNAYAINNPFEYVSWNDSPYRVQFREELRKFKPDIVGFSSNTEAVDAISFLENDIEDIAPGIRTEHGGIDCNKSEWSLAVTKESLFFDPALDLLHGQNPSGSFGAVMTSIGCPYDCIFCGSPHAYSRKLVELPIETAEKRVRDSIAMGANRIEFMDDTFTINKGRAQKIAMFMDMIGIPWKCNTRIDALLKHPDLVKYFKEHGCTQVSFGVESGSPRVLEFIKKRIVPNDVLRVVELLNTYDLAWSGNFMIGFPGETDDDVYESMSLIEKMKPTRIAGYSVVPYPKTELHFNFPGFVQEASVWPFCRWSPFDPQFLCYPNGDRIQGPSAKAVSSFYELIEKINDHEPTQGTFSVVSES